jgi:hypothetical protein
MGEGFVERVASQIDIHGNMGAWCRSWLRGASAADVPVVREAMAGAGLKFESWTRLG